MVLATSSRRRKRLGAFEINDVAQLVRRLRGLPSDIPVPLLVVRLRDLERIAWREGRPAARAVERRSLRSFAETAARTLRATDVLAHDDESEDFVAALISPTRASGSVATPTDCRAALARLASAMEFSGGMRVETGWTIVHGVAGDSRLSAAIERALERGARERERYAFFSAIGHELRTPLTSIRGYLETLLEEELDPATARRFLEVARAEAMRMGRLVDGMFDISMLDLRSGSSGRESSDLATAIASAINAVAPFALGRRTTLTQLPCTPHVVAIGSDRLAQILINVLENAIKHGRDAGRVQVATVALDGRYVEVRIDDDGPGIPVCEREAIFTLARRGTNAQAKGAGLGLAVARLMIERIGGEVDVCDSHLGGAQFRIRLPLMGLGREGERVEAERMETGDAEQWDVPAERREDALHGCQVLI
jgi:signal transduction histidine kinase